LSKSSRVVTVSSVMVGLRMYVFFICAFSVILSGVTVQPIMTSNGGAPRGRRRWLKILWKMWQSRQPYDETLHALNQQRHGSWVLQLKPKKT